MFDAFKNITLFKKTNELSLRVSEFFNHISEAGILFEQTLSLYSSDKPSENLNDNLEKIRKLERRNDQLRRTIEASIYKYTLLPEARADVLRLLEKSDKLINQYESVLEAVVIEKPRFELLEEDDFAQLVSLNNKSVEVLLQSERSFFSNIYEVENSIHKVGFYEKQVDELTFKMKKKLFDNAEIALDEKRQLSYFIREIEFLSDKAEDISDSLIIFTMKRTN